MVIHEECETDIVMIYMKTKNFTRGKLVFHQGKSALLTENHFLLYWVIVSDIAYINKLQSINGIDNLNYPSLYSITYTRRLDLIPSLK